MRKALLAPVRWFCAAAAIAVGFAVAVLAIVIIGLIACGLLAGVVALLTLFGLMRGIELART